MSAALWAASRVLSRELVSRLHVQVWSTVVVVSLSLSTLRGPSVRVVTFRLRDVEPRVREVGWCVNMYRPGRGQAS